MSKLQVAGFLDNSNVNGLGLRSVVFLSGCYHNCHGCHNTDMQNPNYGEGLYPGEILERVKDNMPIIKGVTISGGEPFLQWKQLLPLLKELKSLSLDCWVYTGYTYEDLLNNNNYKTLLAWIDVLVEGPFIENLLSPDLPYVGSSNQRILKLHNGSIKDQIYFD